MPLFHRDSECEVAPEGLVSGAVTLDPRRICRDLLFHRELPLVQVGAQRRAERLETVVHARELPWGVQCGGFRC